MVLGVQLFGQLLDQVQPLHLQRIAPEHFQGFGHIGHLVIAAHLDRHLQVTDGHGAHRGRQPNQATDKVAPDEQPADEERADGAQDVEQHEQDNAGLGGRPRGVAGSDGLAVDLGHQLVDFGQQQFGSRLSSGQRFLFLFQPAQGFQAQRNDPALVRFSHLGQALQIPAKQAVVGANRQGRIGALEVLHGAAEAFLQGQQESAVGQIERLVQQQHGKGGLVVDRDQVPIVGKFVFRRPLGERTRPVRQVAQPLDQVKGLVVDGGDEVAFDAPVRLGQLLPEAPQGLGDDEAPGGRLLDQLQVGAEFAQVDFDQPGLHAEGGTGFQLLDEPAEGGPLPGYRSGHRLVLLGRVGRDEP